MGAQLAFDLTITPAPAEGDFSWLLAEQDASRRNAEAWQAQSTDEFTYLSLDHQCDSCMYTCKTHWRFAGMPKREGGHYTVGPLCPVLWRFNPKNHYQRQFDPPPTVDPKTPWELGWDGMLKKSILDGAYRANYIVDGVQVRSSRENPALGLPPLSEGTWMVDDSNEFLGWGHQVNHLRAFDPADLVPGEDCWQFERRHDVERYADWLKEGFMPPPISVVEHVSGAWRIVNGHRRWAAAKTCGRPVFAWVSYSHRFRDGSGPVGLSYEISVIEAHLSGKPVAEKELRRAVTGCSVDNRRYLVELYPEMLDLARRFGDEIDPGLLKYLQQYGVAVA